MTKYSIHSHDQSKIVFTFLRNIILIIAATQIWSTDRASESSTKKEREFLQKKKILRETRKC